MYIVVGCPAGSSPKPVLINALRPHNDRFPEATEEITLVFVGGDFPAQDIEVRQTSVYASLKRVVEEVVDCGTFMD